MATAPLLSNVNVRGNNDVVNGKTFYKVTSHGPVDLLTDGSVTQKLTFQCDWPSLFNHMPVRGYTSSPDFPGLLCESATAAYELPGIAVVVVTYRGIPFNLPPGDEEMIVSTQEQPIETHPLFVSTLAGTPASPLNGAQFDGTDNVNSSFIRFAATSKYAGLESYLAPTMTFRRNYADFNRPDISKVGFIWTPNDAPTPGGNRNWLCAGITWRKYGGYYSINEDSLMSGPKGWLEDVYKQNNGGS